ncbi:MotA/TolQ/ExbB proton channel family protein [Croceimicrobium hydrocarbonivorans]|uniref:MotA/TolQ/ExbB proton channel family protein n=1 Tax=Croceimicrobium hydrocarbonivorans TaxID=2761580 RepID=A0A7H0VFW3_9FLAO|nr:MotA/TolQ/ExbB proton channel family protein [Croceimicrobium hydrocarbonivorans]QNR24611.1 MotA/TolQ/ExbB proton channel family protein [Croceimicrobium hydrocarbonivorans]
MLEFFYMGGPLFMSLISLAQIAMFIAMILHFQGKDTRHLVREAGLLALALGILGQLIGLYEAFKGIEQMGGVSSAMLAGGLKVSMITTLYGLVGFIISRLYLLIRK